jgi:hypothetical protein
VPWHVSGSHHYLGGLGEGHSLEIRVWGEAALESCMLGFSCSRQNTWNCQLVLLHPLQACVSPSSSICFPPQLSVPEEKALSQTHYNPYHERMQLSPSGTVGVNADIPTVHCCWVDRGLQLSHRKIKTKML